MNSFMMSSIGSSVSAYWCTDHMSKAKMSWPVRACASAAMVTVILLPTAVRKSSWTSTLFFAAQALTSLRMASFPLGTQWSHSARLSRPAAPAVWMLTSGSVEAAAPRRKAWRRVMRVFIGVISLDGGRSARFLNVAEYSTARTGKQVASAGMADKCRRYRSSGGHAARPGIVSRQTGLSADPHDPGDQDSIDRRARGGGDLHARLRSRRAERQQGRDRGAASPVTGPSQPTAAGARAAGEAGRAAADAGGAHPDHRAAAPHAGAQPGRSAGGAGRAGPACHGGSDAAGGDKADLWIQTAAAGGEGGSV